MFVRRSPHGGRGLKLSIAILTTFSMGVAPHTGCVDWNLAHWVQLLSKKVAPHTGAWIETDPKGGRRKEEGWSILKGWRRRAEGWKKWRRRAEGWKKMKAEGGRRKEKRRDELKTNGTLAKSLKWVKEQTIIAIRKSWNIMKTKKEHKNRKNRWENGRAVWAALESHWGRNKEFVHWLKSEISKNTKTKEE